MHSQKWLQNCQMESHSFRVHISCYASFIQPCIYLGLNENRTSPQVLPTFQDKRLASVALLPNNTLVWKSGEASENTVLLCLTASAFDLPLSTFFGIFVHVCRDGINGNSFTDFSGIWVRGVCPGLRPSLKTLG